MRCRVLVAVLLVGSVVACGTSSDPTSDSGSALSTDSTPGTDPSTSVPDDTVGGDDAPPPDLRRGDQGQWVVELQQELTRHGFPVSADGEFGAVTEDAVRDFQSANGLTVDGVVGPLTWAALAAPATIPSSPSPTAASPTTTAETTPPAAQPLVLRSNGLGAVSFDDPADEALAVLTATLGPPDRDSVSTEPDCAPAIEQAQTVSWESLGLTVRFTDWPGAFDLPPAPLHFAYWNHSSAPTPKAALATADGIRIGSTAADVRSLPNSAPFIPNVTSWGFAISDGTGAVKGRFGRLVNLPYYSVDEQFAIALQQALNDRGAELTVDGVFGPATTDALIEFAAQQGIGGLSIEPNYDSIELTPEVLEVFWLLGLPPDDTPVTWMWAGDSDICG